MLSQSLYRDPLRGPEFQEPFPLLPKSIPFLHDLLEINKKLGPEPGQSIHDLHLAGELLCGLNVPGCKSIILSPLEGFEHLFLGCTKGCFDVGLMITGTAHGNDRFVEIDKIGGREPSLFLFRSLFPLVNVFTFHATIITEISFPDAIVLGRPIWSIIVIEFPLFHTGIRTIGIL